jgi:lipoprotein-anchoring transpeptidase ErfK/SrfK
MKPTGRRLALAAAALLAAALVAAALGAALSRSQPDAPGALPEAAAPLPVAPAPVLDVPRARLLPKSRSLSRWLTVLRPIRARAAPSLRAAVVAELDTRTPEGTSNIVVPLGDATDRAKRLWLRVRLPVLPNGTTGWIPRSALGGNRFVRTHLVVDVERFTATLYSNGKPIFRAPVGVGKRQSPTPKGEFHIRNKLTRFRSRFYGPLAFGTSARSAVLTDWPAGGFIGIHGTNRPDLVPGRVSHGCVRLRNPDMLRLARRMPVGTPVEIR